MNYALTICIVNYNSSDFIINTLYCLQKLTKNPYKVIIRDNNSKKKDFLCLKNRIKRFPNVQLYRVENFKFRGSIAHGTAINDLVKKINTKYGVILDADFTFLHKSWDAILINKISEKYPIIGTQAPYLFGSKKPKDFPLMFGVLFDNNILKKQKIDFRPFENSKNQLDTGYQLRESYLKNGYKGKLLLYKATRIFKEGPFYSVICAEYYLKGYKNIFASHFGRGSSLGANKYKRTNKNKFYKIRFIGRYLLKLTGIIEKIRWIKICRNIVDNLH